MVKKTIATIGLSAMAISMSSIEASAMEKGTINTSALNIRSGPSTDYKRIDKAYKGQTVEILEKSNGWYKVKLSNGTVGWASGQYISLGGNSSTSIEGKRGKITASPRLNIRSGAGTNYSIVGKANYGEAVDLLEKSNGWYKVKLSNGTVGWGSGDYVIETTEKPGNNTDNNTNNQQPPTTTHLEGKRGKITANPRLNVRSGAGINYSIVGKANYGDVVELVEKTNGWYKVKLSNGTVGFGSGDYIVETTEKPGNNTDNNTNNQQPPTTTPVEGKRGKITASPRLNIRSGAGTSYSIVGKANYGEVVELVEKTNGWYKIKLSNGVVGWGSSDYVVETTEKPGNSTDDNTNNQQPPVTSNRSEVVNLAYGLLGKPYAWGAEGPNSFDCSGFTKYVYKQAEGKTIPRVSRDQARYGTAVSRNNYAPGDLVYFDTDGDGVVNHVGVYVGGNEFIHCSGTPTNPDKVKKDSLGSSYWSKVLVGARRF